MRKKPPAASRLDSEKSAPSLPPQNRPKLFLGTTQGGGQLLAPEPIAGDTLSRVTIAERYRTLHEVIRRKAVTFANVVMTAREAYTELMPALNEMQKLLSQRGRDRQLAHGLNLPTWSDYVRHLQESMAHVKVDIRTIQRWLQAFRHPKSRTAHRSTKLLKLSEADQRRLIRAALVANDLVAALEAGTEYQALIDEWKRLALTPDAIGKMAEDAVVRAVTITEAG